MSPNHLAILLLARVLCTRRYLEYLKNEWKPNITRLCIGEQDVAVAARVREDYCGSHGWDLSKIVKPRRDHVTMQNESSFSSTLELEPELSVREINTSSDHRDHRPKSRRISLILRVSGQRANRVLQSPLPHPNRISSRESRYSQLGEYFYEWKSISSLPLRRLLLAARIFGTVQENERPIIAPV